MISFSRKVAVVAIFFLFFLSDLAQARVVVGYVTHVFDGDSFNLKTAAGKKYEVRLYGVDCPEKGQPFSNSARKFTSRLIHKKTISLDVLDVDQYRRLVSVAYVDDENVNKKLIADGMAWQYGRYCNKLFCREWKKLEQQARQNKIGLWQDKKPIPPWQWRYQQR